MWSYRLLSSFEHIGKVTDLSLVINVSFVNKRGKSRIMKHKKEERQCIGAHGYLLLDGDGESIIVPSFSAPE